MAESFFATLKVELAHEAAWATRGQARGDVFEYIEQLSRYAGDPQLLC